MYVYLEMARIFTDTYSINFPSSPTYSLHYLSLLLQTNPENAASIFSVPAVKLVCYIAVSNLLLFADLFYRKKLLNKKVFVHQTIFKMLLESIRYHDEKHITLPSTNESQIN